MQEDERIPTNLRLLMIAEVIGRSDRPKTPTEINQELGLPKQSIHRLCKTLLNEGFVVSDGDSSRLRPGRRLRLMAAGILHASRLHITRHQILSRVAREVGETVNFVIPEDKGMVYLDRVETDWVLRIQLPIGSHVPFHCTASGKTFLASLPKGARAAMLRSLNLERLTTNTIGDISSLSNELDRVADRGFAVDNEEFVDGMVAAAVPIHDPEGRYFASIAFHGPRQRLSIDDALARKGALFEAAGRLSEAYFTDLA